MLISRLLKFYLTPKRTAFLKALDNPLGSQDDCLRSILKKMATTSYGKSLGVTGRESYSDFCRKVPIVTYEDVMPLIERQRASGQGNLISPGAVLYYEQTSGSSGTKKMIPYNRRMLGSFTALVKIWAADILTELGDLKTGKFYFSVTPIPETISPHDSQGPQGLADDASYVQGLMQRVFRTYAAVPSSIKSIQKSQDFFLALSCYLVIAEDLEIISIWNPSFLLELLRFMDENWAMILAIVDRGSHTVDDQVYRWKKPHPARMLLLGDKPEWSRVWPMLRLISCWDAAHAGMSAARLRNLFPHVLVQGKGLLATETPLTVPMMGLRGYFPLVSEVFFEFMDQEGKIYRLHELEPDKTYEVLITQHSGLLRYRLGDLVRAQKSPKKTVSLTFVERSGQICDLMGEKLNQTALWKALEKAGADLNQFWLVLPEMTPEGRGRYTVVTDQQDGPDIDEIESQVTGLHHYGLARKLRQLEKMRILRLHDATDVYHRILSQRGIKLGDRKSSLLVRDLALAACFLSAFFEASRQHIKEIKI